MVRAKLEKSANYRSKRIWPENYIDGKKLSIANKTYISCVSVSLQLSRLICKRLKRRAWMCDCDPHIQKLSEFSQHQSIIQLSLETLLNLHSGLTWHCYRDMLMNKFVHSPATHRSHTPSGGATYKLCSQLTTQFLMYTSRNKTEINENFIEIHVFDYTTLKWLHKFKVLAPPLHTPSIYTQLEQVNI